MLYQLSYFRNYLFSVKKTPATLYRSLAKVRGICYSRGKVMLYLLSYFRNELSIFKSDCKCRNVS